MIRVIKQTRKEKIKLYMQLPKKQIAEMLANCNEIIEATRPTVIYPATSSGGSIHASAFNASSSYPTDEGKSKKGDKKLGKNGRGTIKRMGKQKRRAS